MRTVAFGLVAGAALVSVSAFKTPLGRVIVPRQTVGGSGEVQLVDSYNVVYMVNVTIGGTEYPVLVDSGSSDLWVKPPGGSIPGATATTLTYNISYSIGYAAGTIATVPVSFAGFSVPSQAVLDVSTSNSPIFQYGAAGIFGLGFASLSMIDSTVTAAGGNYGHPFLFNAFAQNTSQPNYIAFQLERKNGFATDVQGAFAIGELEQTYSGILQTQPISTYPVVDPTRWMVLLDGYEYADGVRRTLTSTVAGAPQALVLLDTGASYAYASPDLVNGLYSGISGASFDSSSNSWTVPCDQEVNFALWIAGRKFDWHPLDVVMPNVNDNTTCFGSIQPATGLDGFDFQAGDVFLRNLYTMFDFGDYDSTGAMGNPYIRLWSLIDQPTASKEFHTIRGGTTQAYQSSSNTPSNAASNNANVPTGANSTSSTTVLSQDQLYQNINTLMTYAPIALGILGLNALLLVVILAGGIWYMCRRRKGKKGDRSTRGLGVTGLTVPSSLSRSHSYTQVKNDEVETPLAKLNFNDAATHSRKDSHSSSYYANGGAGGPVSPDDENVTAVNDSFRMSTFKDGPPRFSHAPSASKASLRLGPSNLSGVSSVPGSPAGIPSPLPSPGLQPGFRSGSPSPGARKGGSPATSPANVHSDLPVADPSYPQPPSIEIAPPASGASRTQEYLAAMEARKAALAGGGDARRNTYHDETEEPPLQPPTRSFAPGAGPDGRRAMSAYMNNAEPEPLQVPQRSFPAAQQEAPQAMSAHGQPQQQEEVPAPAAQEINMPPGPSRSQEYLQALEARRTALSNGGENLADRPSTYHDPEPLQPPPRRFQGGDGRRATYTGSQEQGEPERGTIYFDAPEAPHGRATPPSSPMKARGFAYSAAQQEGPGVPPPTHMRTGSGASAMRTSPLSSPNRANFNPAPRGSSNLNPGMSAGGPSVAGHGRSGSYAGAPAPRAWSRGRSGLAEETDLTEQRPSFEESAEIAVDAFADGTGGSRQQDGLPNRPFAASPGYRYSSTH